MAQVRIPVRVKPGSSRTQVGGSFGNGELVVAARLHPHPHHIGIRGIK